MITENTQENLKSSIWLKTLIFLVTILLVVVMFPKGESLDSEVTVGSIWIEDDLIASKTFEILKDAETYNRELAEAADRIYPIFIKNNDVVSVSLDSFQNYNSYLINLLDEEIIERNIQNWNRSFLDERSFNTFLKLRKRENIISSPNQKTMAGVFRVSRDLLDRIYRRGMLSNLFEEIGKDSIAVRTGKWQSVYQKRIYLDNNSVSNFIELYLRNNFSTDVELNNAIETYIDNFIVSNLIYSDELTQEEMRVARDKISRNIGIINENERIIGKHDRITPEIKLKIDSYRVAKGEDKGFWGRVVQDMGKFLHIGIILFLYSIYLFLFKKDIFFDNQKILIIAILILFIAFVTFIVRQLDVNAPVELLIFVPVASMLLTIIFDSRVGFYGTVIIALTAGGLRGNDYIFTVMNIVAGALAAYTVRDIKNRSQIFRSFLFILLGYILSIVAFGLERFSSFESIMISSAFAASNALISPILTYGLIIFFERIFKITTDLTLLELSDFNTPALKELAKDAPGTFTHSITIGSLVESGAEVIDANPILARVGAYYHDIGKSLDPDSFVENQIDDSNVHEELDPKKSVEIILRHVEKGIGLAEEYNLPQEVIDFIPMHHGTMVVYYFYEKAKELHGKDNVDINDFRYPGPKPNSKETALVMLADACESTVRSMPDPDPQKVENVINNLFTIRVEDGQLDEAPITFGDLEKIKESFLNSLMGQHHRRIRYPKQDEMESESNNKQSE
ncbi:HD family phosphohydrolase [Bacteroidota bacterium]